MVPVALGGSGSELHVATPPVRVHRMPTNNDIAELSTVRSQLEELTDRVVAVADRYRDTADSVIAADLDHAERSMIAASRAIQHASGKIN